LVLKLLVDLTKLFETAIVNGLEKAALLDAIGRRNVIAGEVILLEGLN